MYLRPILPLDRDPLAHLVRRIENFNTSEVDIALELIDEAVQKKDQSSYKIIVALEPEGEEERILGYICFGKTPMTEHTYDLYWIAVDPERRGRGVGNQLLKAMEESLRHNGGRTIRVETSSRETYDGTLEFYTNTGFIMVGRIPKFYQENDDLIILCKTL
ncbi:MAG: N-acetyltransferase [Myxococcales bacterium]|nr:MAG: N-acetyltransferase [Myxococcales bacterium]